MVTAAVMATVLPFVVVVTVDAASGRVKPLVRSPFRVRGSVLLCGFTVCRISNSYSTTYRCRRPRNPQGERQEEEQHHRHECELYEELHSAIRSGNDRQANKRLANTLARENKTYQGRDWQSAKRTQSGQVVIRKTQYPASHAASPWLDLCDRSGCGRHSRLLKAGNIDDAPDLKGSTPRSLVGVYSHVPLIFRNGSVFHVEHKELGARHADERGAHNSKFRYRTLAVRNETGEMLPSQKKSRITILVIPQPKLVIVDIVPPVDVQSIRVQTFNISKPLVTRHNSNIQDNQTYNSQHQITHPISGAISRLTAAVVRFLSHHRFLCITFRVIGAAGPYAYRDCTRLLAGSIVRRQSWLARI
jgi:hypothetical protein